MKNPPLIHAMKAEGHTICGIPYGSPKITLRRELVSCPACLADPTLSRVTVRETEPPHPREIPAWREREMRGESDA